MKKVLFFEKIKEIKKKVSHQEKNRRNIRESQ